MDSQGTVLGRLLKQVVPEYMMLKLERAAERHRQKLLRKQVVNSRRKYASVVFGSYIERGGSGSIWTYKNREECKGFMEEIDEIGKFMNALFMLLCPEITHAVAQIPDRYKLWLAISLLYWNVSNISKTHRDVLDLDYSLVLPFGNFDQGDVVFTYLNATLQARRGDIYLICSNKVYHNIEREGPERQALVFCNHAAVVKRFCEVDLKQLYNNKFF